MSNDPAPPHLDSPPIHITDAASVFHAPRVSGGSIRNIVGQQNIYGIHLPRK
ncbi:MAG: hypothetical protein WCJ55_18930 [Chloroflexales bacterium]